MDSTKQSGGFVIDEATDNAASESGTALTVKQESKLIHFIDQRLLDVSRLYKRRAVEDSDQAVSASALDQLLLELSSIIKIMAQIPRGSAPIATAYALSILDSATDYIHVFNRSPTQTFCFLAEFDTLFAKLVRQRAVNLTEQTRLNALVARLRLIVFTKYKGSAQFESQCSNVFENTLGLI